MCVHASLSRVRLCVTPWTTAHQAPLSVGFSRKEYCSGLPFPPLGDLPDPGIKAKSLLFPALAGGFFTTSATWEAHSTAGNTNSFTGFLERVRYILLKLFSLLLLSPPLLSPFPQSTHSSPQTVEVRCPFWLHIGTASLTCFPLLLLLRSYMMACLRESCPSAWLLNCLCSEPCPPVCTWQEERN